MTTGGWPGARRGSSCWSGWSICPSFITRSTGDRRPGAGGGGLHPGGAGQRRGMGQADVGDLV
ncbi:hypothetical protein C5706_31560, partial [Klebsiella pneumoniae]